MLALTFHRLRVACTAFVVIACGESTAPLPRDGVPSAFALGFGGFGFGSHDVLLRGDTLVVTRRSFAPHDSVRVTRVVPGADAWAAFWATAREVRVDRWPGACVNTSIVDGGGFSLELASGAGRWRSTGANSYPRATGRCSGDSLRSDEFDRFLGAVAQLIGQPYP